ncbi:MAG: L,D-transpeptidase family protein [Selenomonadaceae bacterium]|nr:L,D-transpeptidase family protein [Selenomonadaceae bacterium]
MRKLLILAVMILTFVTGINLAAAKSTTPQWIQRLPAAQNANQIFVVAQVGGQTTAWVSMHQRDINGEWQQMMTTPGLIGKNGLGKEREGDNKTPVGVFKFNRAFGIAPDPGCSIPYVQVDENYYWSGDFNCRYNELVDIRDYPNLDTANSEHLVDYNVHYVYCLNMGYNAENVAGKGSALFLHCFGPNKTWTAGCVAIPEEKMRFVMRNVNPDCVLVIDSLENLGGSVD